MKRYSSILALALNFYLTILAVRFISSSTENQDIFTDLLILVGLANIMQLGIPVAFSASVARYAGLSERLFRQSLIFVFATCCVFAVIILGLFPGLGYFVLILPFVFFSNNLRGIQEGRGNFWWSNLLKLSTSSVLIWALIITYGTQLAFYLYIVTIGAATYLFLKMKIVVNEKAPTDFDYAPYFIQSIVVLSTVYIDRFVVKIFSDAVSYTNFVLLHEAIYRPVAIFTVFAALHFYQINSQQRHVIFTGLKNYAFQLIAGFLSITAFVYLNFSDFYFAHAGLSLDLGKIELVLVWFLPILSIYLQRVVLGLMPTNASLRVLMAAAITSSLVGGAVTYSYELAPYSLLCRSLVEVVILSVALCSKLSRHRGI